MLESVAIGLGMKRGNRILHLATFLKRGNRLSKKIPNPLTSVAIVKKSLALEQRPWPQTPSPNTSTLSPNARNQREETLTSAAATATAGASCLLLVTGLFSIHRFIVLFSLSSHPPFHCSSHCPRVTTILRIVYSSVVIRRRSPSSVNENQHA
ncbi:hypothetical protein PIB30_023642 [Stylosanthes scabra]|uniref:Uncharacterized protein n=1 Tax=Stylosanthes scabra TaxID=79078 RepID=A0ABU6R9R1_9FABA|nr:hypothetical protein [Stylosanthes scabra]